MNETILKTIFFTIFIINSSLAVPDIKARSVILYDFDSSKILYELEPNAEIHPASMTKIVTSIVVFDLLEKK